MAERPIGVDIRIGRHAPLSVVPGLNGGPWNLPVRYSMPARFSSGEDGWKADVAAGKDNRIIDR